MLKTYIKIAWRNLKKNKLVSLINILGLSLGLATCLVISLYVIEEFSYDRFYEDSDRIFRVNLEAKIGNELLDEASVMAPLATTLKEEVSGVEDATRVIKLSSETKINLDNQVIRKGTTAIVDPNFFQVFSLPFVKGNSATALNTPNSIVLTEEQAKALFGESDPINQVIQLEDIGYHHMEYNNLSGEYLVTGVIQDIPSNSHFHFDMFISMLGSPDSKNQSWLSGSYVTYVRLNEAIKADQIDENLLAISRKYMEGQMQQGMGMSFDEFFAKGNFVYLKLQNLKDIHLNSKYNGHGDFQAGGDMQTVMIYCAIAAFMLLIACINFMNLSTAGASQRLKEIGVRKVMGSDKQQLIYQFLSESFLAICLAMILAFVMASIAVPFFNDFSDKSLTVLSLLDPLFLGIIGLLILLVTLMAGGYPAFFLSSFKPIESLRKRAFGSNKSSFRSGLVVFQFAVSVALIIATLVVSQQMKFIQDKDIGYDREQLVVLRDAGLLGEHLEVFMNELRSDPRISHLTNSAFIPSGPTDTNVQNLVSKDDPTQTTRMMQYGIDEAYISTLGMELISGRNFSSGRGNEKNNIILNETAVKELGITEDPVGAVFEIMTDNQGGREDVQVIGVVKDFVAKSLREPIKPLMMVYNPYYSLILKVDRAELQPLLQDIETTWNGFDIGEAFHYAFLDELYNETYIQEAKMGSFLMVLALMTIFVACLGLFGLVTFTAEQRVKEIGVRKVLGATVNQVVGLLAKDFIKLIVISLVIAIPLGKYLMDLWLADFAYHVEISWWVFALASLIAIAIAFATISLRSVRAALMNPVDSLKSE
ncbi:ABC transporter permease [Algoriphagus sp. PAP.12]|uniref:ABC transporter permease n=1 Tax=Algoriphagus sp. PAP.12 TaxID=2996678 RepID=UPI00227B7976|nr:ABC transporter permease [Algoriphagus sp. PAP.12]